VGKFSLAVLNMFPSMGTTAMQAQISGLRAINPSIKLAQYVVLNEWSHSTTTTNIDYGAPYAAIEANDWWVHTASGAHVQWTAVYGNDEVNITRWAPADAQGRRWPQWKAQWDTSTVLGKLSGLDYVFNDNVMFQPRYDADLMRNGSNQLRSDPSIQAAFRTGYADYWAALRAHNPSLGIIGNADNDLGHAEFKGQLEGAFLECQMGKSWSIETWGGWAAMMKRYRDVMAHTKTPGLVIFQACGANGIDPAQARYGFASVLMDNGLFAYTVNGVTAPYWADEFSAPLGTPVDAPPTVATASGIWMRRYSNGVALVNPGTSTLSIDLGDGYRHIAGSQDPVVNNGQPERVVTLPPKSGLVMIKAASTTN
jgi:hypothetical protein